MNLAQEHIQKCSENPTLKDRGKRYFQFFLEQGEAFQGIKKHKLPKCDNVDFASYRACHHNALMLVIHDKTYKYFEGYAVPYLNGKPMPPTAHAWCLREGKVIDPTWQDRYKKVDYFGIEINAVYAISHMVTANASELILDKYIFEQLSP